MHGAAPPPQISTVHGLTMHSPPWAAGMWENVVRQDVRELAGGFRRGKPPNGGGEHEVLLKYGVRSLRRVWNRCERASGPVRHFAFLIFFIFGIFRPAHTRGVAI